LTTPITLLAMVSACQRPPRPSLGLVGYWDVVAFDEFAGKKKRTDKALVDIM
jgi:predicted ATP-dependent Lon-type protease